MSSVAQPSVKNSETLTSERILVFIPMYNCEKQIVRVLGQFDLKTQAMFSELIIIDNGSKDGSLDAAKQAASQLTQLRCRIFKNDDNYSLGGSHKVAFNYAIQNNFDYVVVLHGDDQGSISDLIPHIESKEHKSFDCLLGARFMRGSQLEGYSLFRTFGNHVFNTIFSIAARKHLTDLGSGLNLYKVSSLKTIDFSRYSDDLTFNYHMILGSVYAGWKMKFFPLTWREDDQVSNVKLYRQAWRTLGIVTAFALNRRRFVDSVYTGRPATGYTSSLVHDNGFVAQ
jgi:dolichol-phosphate mannosyltransferase